MVHSAKIIIGRAIRGGGNNQDGCLKPLLQTQTRNLLWPWGYMDGFFKHIGYDFSKLKVDYGKIAPQPRKEDATPENIAAFARMILDYGSVEDMIGSGEPTAPVAEEGNEHGTAM